MSSTTLEEITNPAEAALMARIVRYFHGAIRSLPNRERAKALSAPDDFWTLLETLALLPVKESPELRVRMRGAIARRALLEQDGGVLSPSNVGELLGISRQAVGLRRNTGKLLGVEGNRGYVYPAWQFEGNYVLKGFVEVLELLRDDDPWTQFLFFLSHDDAIGGKRPIALLRAGKTDQVRRAARMHGEHGAV